MGNRVSVIIPARGRAELVRRAVISVLDQTLLPYEVILVDDGSPTPLSTELPEIRSSKLVVLRHTPGVNAAFARNLGIDQATGEFIAFLDSDDWWRPNHLWDAVKILSEGKSVAMVSSYESDYGAGRRALFVQPESSIASGKDMIRYLFEEGGEVRTSTIVLRAEGCSQARFDEALEKHQDWDFAVTLGNCGRVHFNSHVSVVVDRTAESRMSSRPNPSATARFLSKHKELMTPDSRNGFLLWAATSATLQQDANSVNQILAQMRRPVSFWHRFKSAGLKICVCIPGLPRVLAEIYLRGLRLRRMHRS